MSEVPLHTSQVWGVYGHAKTVALSCSEDEAQKCELFRGVLVFKAHRLLYHSTLGSIMIKKKR